MDGWMDFLPKWGNMGIDISGAMCHESRQNSPGVLQNVP